MSCLLQTSYALWKKTLRQKRQFQHKQISSQCRNDEFFFDVVFLSWVFFCKASTSVFDGKDGEMQGRYDNNPMLPDMIVYGWEEPVC